MTDTLFTPIDIEKLIDERFGEEAKLGGKLRTSLYEGLFKDLLMTVEDELSKPKSAKFMRTVKKRVQDVESYRDKLPILLSLLEELFVVEPRIMQAYALRARQYLLNIYIQSVRENGK